MASNKMRVEMGRKLDCRFDEEPLSEAEESVVRQVFAPSSIQRNVKREIVAIRLTFGTQLALKHELGKLQRQSIEEWEAKEPEREAEYQRQVAELKCTHRG